MTQSLLRMSGITKAFPGVKALDQVSFQLEAGEIHALLGENGAGKSTLMKVLSGVYRKDEGQISLSGQEVEINSPRQASELGIGIIHQELNLVPALSVMENIFLGREPRKGWGLIDFAQMKEAAAAVLAELDADIEPEDLIEDLSIGKQQLVEIAKALSYATKILIMDEPTTALTETETQSLFAVIRNLAKKGLGIIYISHRMEELFALSDRITVMRDGQYVGTVVTKQTKFEDLIKMMVGRELSARFPKIPCCAGEVVLQVEKLRRRGVLENVSFELHQGEILGVAGLMGSGRSELARALFGADPLDSGTILISGEEVKVTSPQAAIAAGIALVTEDRKGQGLILGMSIRENMTLPSLKECCQQGIISPLAEENIVTEYLENLKIRTPNGEKMVSELSGGNQQKVVLAKWLATKPKVLIMDEPTRGVDVGAKAEIYQIMSQLVKQGVAILMISSELPEILGLSDRVLVMHRGTLAADIPIEEASQEKIMAYAAGGREGEV